MDTREIAPGLWRWTAPHPDWTPENDRPGGWGERVGAVYFEAPPPAEAVVLIDPLAPPDGTADADRFWALLDRDVSRAALPLTILLSNRHHGRSARVVYRRFAGRVGAAVYVPRGAEGRVACEPTHLFDPGEPLPGAVESYGIDGLDEPEVAFFLRPHRALVLADAVIGAGGGEVRVAPASWSAGDDGGARYRERFRASLARLVGLDANVLLPSHGEPVLALGAQALAAALRAPAWGEG